MALNALVDSFLPQSAKCGFERVNVVRLRYLVCFADIWQMSTLAWGRNRSPTVTYSKKTKRKLSTYSIQSVLGASWTVLGLARWWEGGGPSPAEIARIKFATAHHFRWKILH